MVIPGLPHHVTQRGNRREPIFFEDGDHEIYCEMLAEQLRKSSVEVWAYCLMPNHVHLILNPQQSDFLGRALGEAHRRYTNFINARGRGNDPVWNQQAGPTVFSPFPEKTTYFGDATKQWMINFRVGDLDKMAGQLEAPGIAVKVDPATYPNVRFARIHDPEGTPIELWQPLNAVTVK
jgi:REP element-mobilizing transposase RayT